MLKVGFGQGNRCTFINEGQNSYCATDLFFQTHEERGILNLRLLEVITM